MLAGRDDRINGRGGNDSNRGSDSILSTCAL